MRGLRAVALGVSISIDELAIGFTLGLLHISAVLVIALIAVQTLVVTQLGLQLGGRLSEPAARALSGSPGSRWQRSGSFCWPRSSWPDPRVASCRHGLHLRGGDEAGTVLNNPVAEAFGSHLQSARSRCASRIDKMHAAPQKGVWILWWLEGARVAATRRAPERSASQLPRLSAHVSWTSTYPRRA
jgi:hypothetical protein